MHSFKDGSGKWWVACCECKRGGNGDESCSGGGQSQTFDGLGCFSGNVKEGLDD